MFNLPSSLFFTTFILLSTLSCTLDTQLRLMNTDPQWPSDSFCNKTFERSLPWTTSKNDRKYFYFCLYQKRYQIEKPESFCDFKIDYYESQNFTNIPHQEKLIFVGCIEKKLLSIGLHQEVPFVPPDIFITNVTSDTISKIMPLILAHVFQYVYVAEKQKDILLGRKYGAMMLEGAMNHGKIDREKIIDCVRKNGGSCPFDFLFPELFEDFTERDRHYLKSLYYVDSQFHVKLSNPLDE